MQTDWVMKIGGSSNQNIFAAGDNWLIYHWDGSDWKQIHNPFTGVGYFTCIWTNNIETFLVGVTGTKSYVFHGK